MKLALTSALALAIAAPAFAGSAETLAAENTGGDANYAAVDRSELNDGFSPRAILILNQLASENTGGDRHFITEESVMTASTKGGVSPRAAAIFAAMEAAEDAADK